AVVATSEAHTDGTDVVVGEVVRYRLSVPLPEGVIGSLVITDTLGTGLAPVVDAGVRAAVMAQDDTTEPVSATSLTGVPVYTASTVPAVLDGDNSLALAGPSVVSFTGNELTVNLGDVTNAPGVAGAETLILEFNAVVTDAATNVEGASLSNTATVATGGRTLPQATADVTVREPVLSISKAVVETDSDYSRLLANGNLENADVGEEVT